MRVGKFFKNAVKLDRLKDKRGICNLQMSIKCQIVKLHRTQKKVYNLVI